MPKLVRLYLFNIAIGFVLALLFTALLLMLNVANLRHLTANVAGGSLAIFLLVAFNTIVFASVQFAIAVMRLAAPEPPKPGGLRERASLRLRGVAALLPAAARSPARRARDL
ncbi:MAG: hypothetical protein Q4F71_08010 [Paracoccus sp. (in: a-proteobacteria)]|nr:hypothetical protein [Paracoccus sp. (in: a-proteobacteria)]